MRVAVVGGGVAGLSAAEALQRSGVEVVLYEAKSRLGGRAGSFFDKPSGRWIDLCQHIGMGCCTEWLDFCRRTSVMEHLRRDRVLHFVGDGAKRYRFAATNLLPPPLHLTPALLQMSFLSWRERMHLVQTLRALQACRADDHDDTPSIGQWLAGRGVSQRALRRFYEPVLISALGETLDRASLPVARKVFVEGFLTTRDGFHLLTPNCSLTELYNDHVARHLTTRGVRIERSTAVKRIMHSSAGGMNLEVQGQQHTFDAVVVALPWMQLAAVLDPALHDALPWLAELAQIAAAPITGVHLWFDRPIMDLPHAAVLDRLSQWVFAAPEKRGGEEVKGDTYYFQVIVSASHALRERTETEILTEVLEDLEAVLPMAKGARLLRGKVVTEHHAVFSVRPGLSRLRPSQQTAIDGLAIAGDWTATGWPATMESAVRSGRLAAEAIVTQLGGSP